MKSIKKILLPESNEIIKNAISKCNNLNEIEIINEYELKKEWFDIEGLNFDEFDIKQKILINSFLGLKHHDIDGLIVGIDYSSKDVFKWAIKLLNKEKKILSSCFVVDDNNDLSVWGDCAFNIEPNLNTSLVNINGMIDIAKKLNLYPINVKLLSYSTNNSGSGLQIDFINQLSSNLKEIYLNNNEINISNNIQFDAAFNSIISEKKNIDFLKPKVVWFPNLMSGNIGYKIAQHYGKMTFAGPFILGLNYLVSDLSRGANVQDIVLTIQTMIKML